MRETKKKCGSWHGKSLRLETKFKKYKLRLKCVNGPTIIAKLFVCQQKRNKYEGFIRLQYMIGFPVGGVRRAIVQGLVCLGWREEFRCYSGSNISPKSL